MTLTIGNRAYTIQVNDTESAPVTLIGPRGGETVLVRSQVDGLLRPFSFKSGRTVLDGHVFTWDGETLATR